MKHVITALGLGACVVLSSASVALAADPHNAANPTGQPGAAAGSSFTCGSPGFTSTPSGSVNGNSSPFNTIDPTKSINYAGNAGNPTADKGVGNPAHSISEYDVACFQATQKQIP